MIVGLTTMNKYWQLVSCVYSFLSHSLSLCLPVVSMFFVAELLFHLTNSNHETFTVRPIFSPYGIQLKVNIARIKHLFHFVVMHF